MARPRELALDTAEQPWRAAPMPGANRPLDLVRLESSGGTFAILGRFPAGFERPVAGGYAVAEEFVVLRGALELEGTTVGPATLCYVPAHHRRAPMRSPHGCTVLAWFSGPPRFRPAEELRPDPGVDVATAAVGHALPGSSLLRTSEADWRIADVASLQAQGREVDVIDLAGSWWARVGAAPPSRPLAGPVLARIPLADTPA